MYQKDFIIFLIEQFARIVAKILARIANREYDDAELRIEQVYRQYLGLNSDLINSMSWKTLMAMQRVDPEAYPERCLVLARLLQLEARIFLERRVWKDARARGVKALNIYLSLPAPKEEQKRSEMERDISETHELLVEILEKSDPDSGALPPETRELWEAYQNRPRN